MREEPNPTVATSHGAVLQIGTVSQKGIQSELILTNKRTSAIVLIRIFAKRENLGDGYRQMAKFSVKMLSGLCISSSYSLDAKASRGRAGIFHA